MIAFIRRLLCLARARTIEGWGRVGPDFTQPFQGWTIRAEPEGPFQAPVTIIWGRHCR